MKEAREKRSKLAEKCGQGKVAGKNGKCRKAKTKSRIQTRIYKKI